MVAATPTPFPYSESVTVDLTVALPDPLKALFLSMISGTDPSGAMQSFFDVLALWLSTPPWVVTVSSGTLLNPITGVGVATFPSMSGMATPCFAEMSVVKPTELIASWNIMGTHIYNGLVANVIPPIPTTGTHPAGAYTGVTTATLTFP